MTQKYIGDEFYCIRNLLDLRLWNQHC